MKKTHVSSLQFRLQGAQTIIFLGDISAVMGLKIEKVGPSFSTFNSCPLLSFIATGDRKQSQCLNKVLLHFFQKHANSEVQKPTDICIFHCRQSF